MIDVSELILQAMPHIMAKIQLPIVGTLLFGSRAGDTASEESDIDLLLLVETPLSSARKLLIRRANHTLDILSLSQTQAFEDLHTDGSAEQLFLLNACMEGIILQDDRGALRSIVERASTIWQAGPKPYTLSQKAGVCREIQHGIEGLERAYSQCQTTADQGLLRLRCGELFRRTFHVICRDRGLWTSSLRRTLIWAKVTQPDLYERSIEYLESINTVECISALRRLFLLMSDC